jgi:hypothetical protein
MDVEFPYTSGLPRDVAINSWFAATTADDAEELWDSIKLNVYNFYYYTNDDQTNPIGSYMSKVIDRPRVNIKVYDLSKPDGTPPFDTETATLPPPLSGGFDLPLQVALCASFRSSLNELAGSTQLPLARRSGRAYIGPLNSHAINDDPTAAYPLPDALFISDLVAASKQLVNNNTRDFGIAIYSRASNQYTIMESGWVDNEWDIQRRRRVDANQRNAWSNPL